MGEAPPKHRANREGAAGRDRLLPVLCHLSRSVKLPVWLMESVDQRRVEPRQDAGHLITGRQAAMNARAVRHQRQALAVCNSRHSAAA